MNMIRNVIKKLGIALFVPIIIMMFTIMIFEYHNTNHIYQTSMSIVARRVNSGIERYFDSLNEKLKIGADNEKYKVFFEKDSSPDVKKQVEKELIQSAKYSNFVEDTVVTNVAAKVVAGDIEDVAMYINTSYFDKARKTKTPVLDTTFKYLNDEVVFTIYVPVSFGGDIVNAMIIRWVNVEMIQNLITNIDVDDAENVFVIDSDSNVLGYSKDNTLAPLASFKNNDGLMMHIKNIMSWATDEVHSIRYTDENGVKKDAVFWRNSAYDMTVVCEKNHSVVVRSAVIVTAMITFFAVLIVVFGLMAYFKVKKMVKQPFDEVIQAAGEYEQGNFSYRPVISGDDEISNITESLWNMAMKISDIYEDVRENEHCFRKSLEFASDMLTDYTISKNKYVADTSKWYDMFGFEFIANEKKTNEEIFNRLHDDDKNQFKAYRDKIFTDIYDNLEKQMQIEFRIKMKDNEYHWILRRDILVKGKTDDIEHVLTSYALIDERKKTEIELSSKAHYDQMTKLYNRATFMMRAKEWMKNNENAECSMIFVDADNFKSVNDTYGHEAGDDVIRYMADTLRTAVDDKGLCGRYGGDEFIAFIYDSKNAEEIAKKVVEIMPNDFQIPSQPEVVLSVHSSAGIANYPEHAYDAENLLKRADEAMYVAKKSGKDRYVMFNNSIKLS